MDDGIDAEYRVIRDADGSNLVHLTAFGSSSRGSTRKSSQSLQFDRTTAAELLRIFLEADLVSDLAAASSAVADQPEPEQSVPDLAYVSEGSEESDSPNVGVTEGLVWGKLDDSGFERLLFDLFRRFPRYQNVEWLTHTRAPDRGRDLSAERVIVDDGGTTRTERVLIQAKHWKTKSVGPVDICTTLAPMPLWEPPVIRGLIIATSGRFTADAVALAEKHNNDGKLPYLELWPDSRLEALLANHPDLVSRHGLRRQ
ncbi:restriction endonuclease [Nocardia sp. NPDC051756]|uniref:restriction endonuclease n=1 Tax=Nocardia sp. NPDC051756 TaxID=3154751 RepID=UPI00342F3539